MNMHQPAHSVPVGTFSDRIKLLIQRVGSATEIARRARGTPRIANHLLRRVRDYAQVRARGHITMDVAETALNLLEVDRFGLDEIDQKIMRTVLEKFGGGPVGISTIAASIGEEAETIEEAFANARDALKALRQSRAKLMRRLAATRSLG